MELSFLESKTTVYPDGTSITEYYNTLVFNSPIQITSSVGMQPVGSIIAWTGGYFGNNANNGFVPVLAGDSVASANAYLNSMGWYVCDGSAVNDSASPIWNSANRYLPNLSDGRFLMGSTSVSSTATGGSNTLRDHTHSLTGITASGESAHTHAITGVTVAGEAAHTHSWGGHWSIDDARYVTGGNGDGSGNTYSDGIASVNYWGTGWMPYHTRGTGTDSPDHTHNIYMGDLDDLNCTHAWGQHPLADGPNTHWTGITTDGANARHAHDYYLPSHRHWIMSRGTSAGSSHTHTLSGSVASGSSHTHTISGGTAGSGSVPTSTENRPQYLRCFMIIRIK